MDFIKHKRTYLIQSVTIKGRCHGNCYGRQCPQDTKLGQPIQVPGIIFTVNDTVIPDLLWVSNARLASHTDQAGHLTIAPELMVEVLSPGE